MSGIDIKIIFEAWFIEVNQREWRKKEGKEGSIKILGSKGIIFLAFHRTFYGSGR